MKLVFDPNALEDLRFWIDKGRKALRIVELIEHILREPFQGIGKPQPLRFELKGCWSRRIDQEHRVVYKVEKGELVILACRYHYEP
ncbi:MAG: Txe/YoeB family addiction module toxin [Proteobacteria bacterium]|nr:Txe/YoeB family addiction module toxin [Pseudomonadota bacterium]